MHRVGARRDVAVELAGRIDTAPGVVLGGVWTHLAVAEEDDHYTALQVERFAAFLAELDMEGIAPGIRHCANTAAA
ncbi:MAG: alanine racemase, partial [Actinobacteria bacterium]|nr:alanine racemase [Actinomycetota bacterium]NIS34506.1 alanine racemase [Actinomycetota bacterium]NIT97542.1 alanine racemase [Actinomycetota bacterium]NIU69270.1 alanine racemase [Actinomycetota bacterium]NIV57722.1 alanine racemase [Actinomycetota bacterium]